MNEERRVTSKIKIEDARLIFRNFKGEGSQYNSKGDRNFGVLLNDDLAADLVKDGWNVKFRKPREDDPEQYRQPWLPVKVRFGKIPPIITLIKPYGKMLLDEESVDQLDWTVIEKCDLIIRPYNYPSIAGRPAGVSAYLKAIYVTTSDDDLERKYADIPYLNQNQEPLPFDE